MISLIHNFPIRNEINIKKPSNFFRVIDLYAINTTTFYFFS